MYITSLFPCILAAVVAVPADARIVQKNAGRSYADGYNQVNAMRYQQEYMDATALNAATASSTESLPVDVEDKELANAILNNDESAKTSMAELDACAMIYPNAVFKWGIPESGVRRNQANQCMAVVELRDAKTNAVLATTTLGAGDSMKCNVDSFPESGMSSDLRTGKVEVPADAAPTMEDVEAIMNEEQKQNAGLKIVAGALIAGVAGNLLAPKDSGQKNSKIPIGTSQNQLKGTAIGAVTGAGIMAASTYTGKVAGDTIKSTAVNATSGVVIGNMLAGAAGGGDKFLSVTKCKVPEGNTKVERDCIRGYFAKIGEPITKDSNYKYLISKNEKVYKCTPSEGAALKECILTGQRLTNVMIADKSFNDVKKSPNVNSSKYEVDSNVATTYNPASNSNSDNVVFLITSADTVEAEMPAYAVFKNGIPSNIDATYDWSNIGSKATFYLRNSDGTVGDKEEAPENKVFRPISSDASSGGLIDLSNKARLKGTVAGGAAGGALGGFAGYQGAKAEVTDRWTAAQREYEDSLSNFVCISGGRYLSKYNDYVEIPVLKKSE